MILRVVPGTYCTLLVTIRKRKKNEKDHPSSTNVCSISIM